MTLTATVTDTVTGEQGTRTASFTVASSMPPLGALVGQPPGTPAQIAAFAAATGVNLTLAQIDLPREDGWAGFANPDLSNWLSGWVGTKYQTVFMVPMIAANSKGKSQGTLAAAAAGTYNPYYLTQAEALVAAGFGNGWCRLGWEFDSPWSAWAVSTDAQAALYAQAYQQMVETFRSVPGQAFKFVFSMSLFNWQPPFDITQAYPGDSYVDDMGADLYNQWTSKAIFGGTGVPQNVCTVAQSNEVWQSYLTLEPPDGYGLNWLVAFAAEHGKGICIPEWANVIQTGGGGLGDDPTFVTNMAAWLKANNAWSCYYEDDEAGSGDLYALTDGSFPHSLAAFTEAFG